MDGGEHSGAGVLVGADSGNAAYEGGMVCRICFSNSTRSTAVSSQSYLHFLLIIIKIYMKYRKTQDGNGSELNRTFWK